MRKWSVELNDNQLGQITVFLVGRDSKTNIPAEAPGSGGLAHYWMGQAKPGPQLKLADHHPVLVRAKGLADLLNLAETVPDLHKAIQEVLRHVNEEDWSPAYVDTTLRDVYNPRDRPGKGAIPTEEDRASWRARSERDQHNIETRVADLKSKQLSNEGISFEELDELHALEERMKN